MTRSLEIGFQLDRLWHALRGEMERSKKPALLALAEILESTGVPYAVIGGVALQIHQSEPRTTLDIDLAIPDRSQIPEARLVAAGFARTGQFEHSDNWIGPESVPVQFSDDPLLRPAIDRAVTVVLDGISIRVIEPLDLVREKLRAATDPARRRSKRLQDLVDAERLIEERPDLTAKLTAAEREALGRLPS